MARLVGVRQIWTLLLGYLAALAALIIGPARTMRWLDAHEHPATGLALAAVALGTLSLLPVILLLVWLYQRSDEYERHGMLLVSSVGFAVTLLIMTALDLLGHTELARRWVWSPRWWTVVSCWIIALIAVRFVRGRTR